MKSISRNLIFMIALILAFGGSAYAATRSATNCSNTAIQTAINAAVDGDVVMVPAGTATWTGNVTIPNTKGITLQGAGSASTVITLNGYTLIVNTSSTRQPLRITGFKFIHTNTSLSIRITGTAQDWRIDNNIIDGNNVPDSYSIRIGADDANVDSYTYGVIDHNQFINRDYSTSIFVEWSRGDLDPRTPGDWIWSQPAQRGTAQAVYVEDNVFTGTKRYSQVIDARWGAKYVVRYNTIHNPWISTHSGCTNNGREPLWVEIYKNTFTDDSNHVVSAIVQMRSVSGIVWANTAASKLQFNTIYLDHERSYRSDCGGPYGAMADGTRAFDENVGAHGYRALGQPGWGPPQATNMSNYSFAGMFNWGNLDAGANINMTIYGAGYSAEHLQQGRDFFNASNLTVGTLAGRPSTCTVTPSRSVYVATNENSQGATLYVATAANVWSKHWEPFTYPHPLTTGQSQNLPPDAPKNIRVQ